VSSAEQAFETVPSVYYQHQETGTWLSSWLLLGFVTWSVTENACTWLCCPDLGHCLEACKFFCLCLSKSRSLSCSLSLSLLHCLLIATCT
jgi:hypothetical protein